MAITETQKERMEYALQRLNCLNKDLNTMSRWGAIEAIKLVLENAEIQETTI